MIRITQSFLIRKIAEHLSENQWKILYTDYPQASRGGIGIKALVHTILETIYDRAPDILAYKNENLLLIEVNNKLEKRYIDKFLEFDRNSSALISELQEKLDMKIADIKYGFGMMNQKIDTNVLKSLAISLTIFLLDSKYRVIEKPLQANQTFGK